MFDNAITLNPTSFGGANVNKVYDLIGTGSSSDSSSIRRVSATATTTPETLRIAHQVVGSKETPADQHLVRLDKLLTDTIKGQVQLSAWMVIKVPKGTTIVTLQEIKDIVGRLIALEQSSGALDRLLNGEP